MIRLMTTTVQWARSSQAFRNGSSGCPPCYGLLARCPSTTRSVFLLSSSCLPPVFLLSSSWLPLVFLLSSSFLPPVFLQSSSCLPPGSLLSSSRLPPGFLLSSSWLPFFLPPVFLLSSFSLPPVFLMPADVTPQGGELDTLLDGLALTGMLLSLVVIVRGAANVPILTALWVLYMSLVNVEQNWFSFGWESQLMETGLLLSLCLTRAFTSGFLAIWCVPLVSLSWLPSHLPSPALVVWGNGWLIVRIMLGAGLIKVSLEVTVMRLK